jgi:hypothetical protein
MNSTRQHGFAKIFRALLIGLSVVAVAPKTFAHCDGLDGPVVQAARQALDSGNVNLVLIWIQKRDEDEIRKAFSLTLAVRTLSAEARELSDRSFFETLVRIHRAGEGASFTGLKPASRDLGPAIPAADKALRDGNVNDLKRLLRDAVGRGVSEHFSKAASQKDFDKKNVEAGREFVKAYVEYIHCVEALYETATHPTHGHYDDTEKIPPHNMSH